MGGLFGTAARPERVNLQDCHPYLNQALPVADQALIIADGHDKNAAGDSVKF
jgi:hypothetical protein